MLITDIELDKLIGQYTAHVHNLKIQLSPEKKTKREKQLAVLEQKLDQAVEEKRQRVDRSCALR